MAPPAVINRPTPLEAPPQPLPEGPPQTMSPPGAINSPKPQESLLPPLPNEMPPTMSPPGAINSPTPIRPAEASGSNADQVRNVQESLKAKGYDIAVNGMLDLPTVNAIKAFQGSNDMPRSGTIDEALLAKLKQ
jgi:peptidoglycan hydrolase-like protein with peptidoglycan-binding domain